MKKGKSIYLGIGIGVFVVCLLLLPYLSTNLAQTEGKGKGGLKAMPTATPDQSDKVAKAREAVAKSAEGSLVLQTITIKEPEWKLTKGYFSEFRSIPEEPLLANLTFEKEDLAVHITIARFDSHERAKAAYSSPRSHGWGTPVKLGDQGEKVYSDADSLMVLKFRLNNYVVSIGTRDDELAKKFAEYVLEALQ